MTTAQLTHYLAGFSVVVWLLISLAFLFWIPAANAQSLEDAVECGSNLNFNTADKCKQDTKEAKKDAVADCVRKKGGSGSQSEKTEACKAEVSAEGQLEGLLKTVLNLLSVLAGIIAVIMIIIGGFKYVTSSGDANSAGSAKNTIIYALVGLVIAAFAQIIVQFVLERAA